jgi:hypothetical protein
MLALAVPEDATWQGFADGLTARLSGKGMATGRCLPWPRLRWSCFADSLAVGKECLCRWLSFADGPALGKEIFADGGLWPSTKAVLCRRLIPWPSVKDPVVGNDAVSGSVS